MVNNLYILILINKIIFFKFKNKFIYLIFSKVIFYIFWYLLRENNIKFWFKLKC